MSSERLVLTFQSQVVCSLNWQEDMSDVVDEVNAFRWKVFQVLVVNGENKRDQRKRNATKFVITDEQFATFCQTHGHLDCLVPEPNSTMKSIYLVSLIPVALRTHYSANRSRSSMSTCGSWTKGTAMRNSLSRFWNLVFRKPSSKFDGIKNSSETGVECMIGRKRRLQEAVAGWSWTRICNGDLAGSSSSNFTTCQKAMDFRAKGPSGSR